MKLFLLPLVFVCCSIGLSCQVTAQTKPDTVSGPKFTFSETLHDFGTIRKDTVLEYNFSFTNSGKGALMIQSISKSCECISVEWERKAIMPGERGLIHVQVPVDQNGPFYRLIWISSNVTNNNPDLGSFELSIKGVVAKPVAKKKHKGPQARKQIPRTNF